MSEIRNLHTIDTDELKNYWSRILKPSNVTIYAGASEISHNEVVDRVNKLCSHVEKDTNENVNENANVCSPYYKVKPLEYKGGFLGMEDKRHEKIGITLPGNYRCYDSVFIGFKGPHPYEENEFYISCVLSKLLGDGKSFSSGGPGKGMYNRVFRGLLGYGFVEECNTINFHTLGGSIFGLCVQGTPSFTDQLIYGCARSLSGLLKISEEELSRAKNQMFAEVCQNTESICGITGDTLRQVTWFNERKDYEYYYEKLQAITVEQTVELVRKMLSSKPTVIILAEGKQLESVNYDEIAAHFR